jgi:hypothetical protein
MRVLPDVRFASLVACAAALACGEITSTPVYTPLDYLLGESNGALTGPPVSFISAAPPATAAPPLAGSCPYDTTSTMFVCVDQMLGGGTFHTRYQLLDAGTQPLAARDVAGLATVRTIRTSDFVVALPGDAVLHNVHNVSDRTLSGLLSDERIVNGQDTIIRLKNSFSVARLVTEVVTISNFRPRRNIEPGTFPASGTITVQTDSVKSAGTAPVPVSYVMTFTGAATVSWVRNVGGVVATCTYNMATATTPVCQ